jgi:hypothetical protein
VVRIGPRLGGFGFADRSGDLGRAASGGGGGGGGGKSSTGTGGGKSSMADRVGRAGRTARSKEVPAPNRDS